MSQGALFRGGAMIRDNTVHNLKLGTISPKLYFGPISPEKSSPWKSSPGDDVSGEIGPKQFGDDFSWE